MGKCTRYKLPSAKSFLKKKRKYDKKKDPVWVYLEREMIENIAKKPYNHKVGTWLTFLRDLRYYFFCEAKKQYKRLHKEAGPAWYLELSMSQRAILYNLKSDIHKDTLQNSVMRVKADLHKLGLNIKFDRVTLKQCMNICQEDPGLFLWHLYESHYKMSPSVPRLFYDLDAMIIMSSFVFLDYDECFRLLKIFVKAGMSKRLPPPPAKKTPKYWEPQIKYGVYLQKMYAPSVDYLPEHMSHNDKPCQFKICLKSKGSYEMLQQSHSFMEKRIEQRLREKTKLAPRVCNYEFWKAPARVKWTGPVNPNKNAKKLQSLQAYSTKPKNDHHKNQKRQLSSTEQYNLGSVVYSGDQARYLIHNLCIVRKGIIPINLGQVKYGDLYIPCIQGYIAVSPIIRGGQCQRQCNCLQNWDIVEKHLKDTKCTCGHYFDSYEPNSVIINEDRKAIKETYFHPPTKYSQYWLDEPQIYMARMIEDDIKKEVLAALESEDSIKPEKPILDASLLTIPEILEAFFGEIAETSLIMPHLPKVNYLNSLRDWVRKKMHGKYPPDLQKKMYITAQRRWVELDHIDFKARANFIPFTMEEQNNFNWGHRSLLNELFDTLLEDFTVRNGQKLVEQTRMFWPTMHYHVYPSPSFRDVFFTYMPATIRDTFFIRPYDSAAPRRPLPIQRMSKEM